MTVPVFSERMPGYGTFGLRPLRIPDDIPTIHDWVHRDYARFWGLVGASVAEVEETYRAITARPHVEAFLGFHEGSPAFLVETYLPAEDPIAAHYDARPSDRGMHVLVAPATTPIAGFGFCVFTVVMDFVFDDPSVERVVVEPDVRNEKIHALNRRAGFEYQRLVELPASPGAPAKTAHLAFCTRDRYDDARRKSWER